MNFLGTASDITPAAASSSISCENSTYWAPTVSNWAEENVDGKLSSWALNLVPDQRTAIVKGSFPTQLPQIFTGFGNTTNYENVIGIPGQLMSIAKGGMDASCELLDGPNEQCPSIDVSDACGFF